MKTACRRALAALAILFSGLAAAAPYPSETQLQTAIGTSAAVLQKEGLELEMLDARKEGIAFSLLAAGLDLETGTCLIFYNTKPVDILQRFFHELDEKELPIWLSAMAVHETTHCIEQREAYLRQHFDKVLPPGVSRENMTVQGYLSVVKSGAVETWGEALADIASVLYLQQAAPERWVKFAKGIAALRQERARKSPEHDTSAWLLKMVAEKASVVPEGNLFEAAFRLRRQLQAK